MISSRDALLKAKSVTMTYMQYAVGAPRSAVAVVRLTRADFATGPVRLRHPRVVVKLTEDIDFDPSPSVPVTGTDAHPFPPYQLGFFAAVVVETSDVCIDLNGHVLRQSPAHKLRQRFFAVIELGSQPFIEGQGPSAFGPLVPCARVYIYNGVLGASSHHGIHGNNCSSVLLQDLVIQNFEVGGVHLNGASGCVVASCLIGPGGSNVTVNARLSQAQQLLPTLRMIDGSLVFNGLTGLTIRETLEAEIAQALRGTTPELFANPGAISDGACFGVVLNGRGAFVNGFRKSRPTTYMNRDNLIMNVTVQQLASKTNEVRGLASFTHDGEVCDAQCYGSSMKLMRGPVGDVFDIDLATDQVSQTYRRNALSDAQLFIAKHSTGPRLIDACVVKWAETAGDRLDTLMASCPADLYFVYQCDAMAHVSKGPIGIVIQQGELITVTNAEIRGVRSLAEVGKGMYTGTSLKTATLAGFNGGTARGMLVGGCTNVTVEDLRIVGVSSETANSIGIDIIGDNVNLFMQRAATADIRSASEPAGGVTPANLSIPVRRRVEKQNTLMIGQCPAMVHRS